jgi:3-methyl-2-oxobutanoate hydroxymethyltransferase
MKKWSTRALKTWKEAKLNTPNKLCMLTCYDYQTAQLFNQTQLDLILVGDSLGNVVLGFETTVEVTLEHMIIFGQAVKRGAPDKFIVVDMPFGAISSFEKTIENAVTLFTKTNASAIKIEGAEKFQLDLIQHLTSIGIPVMGHIGLQPQSVHQQGGYFIHGKDQRRSEELLNEAIKLSQAGAFSVVLECVQTDTAKLITEKINIPTIGIGSGSDTDGQVLVTNDLLKMGLNSPPKFCTPIADLFSLRKNLIDEHILKIQQ